MQKLYVHGVHKRHRIRFEAPITILGIRALEGFNQKVVEIWPSLELNSTYWEWENRTPNKHSFPFTEAVLCETSSKGFE